ncbi:MAG: hypothetical protein BroJett022_19320 [Actinomycetes bacterium]|nr:MAG: hypothetical protein BroJett022_19320 [Actinomycetes bacterium]
MSEGRSIRSRRPGAAAVLVILAALLFGGCAFGVTQPATDVGATTATVTGLVADTEDGASTYWFEYGPTKSYGSETTHRAITISDRDGHPVSEELTGLDPETKYHYRLCAKSEHPVCGIDYAFTTGAGPAELEITAAPDLYPDFDPQVPDYVTRCNNGPVDVTVEAPVDTAVAVDGGPARNGTFTTTVPLASGQEFELATDTDVGTSTYHVRCLPNDFPDWTFTEYGPAQQKWYLVTPRQYAVMFDGNGVPVWWRHDPIKPGDFKLLPDGTLAVSANDRYYIRDLDGNLLNTLRTVGTELDSHDLQLLPNGNYMLMSYKPRANPIDMTAYGGPPDGIALDAELQEVEPDGDLVWSWNSKDHVGLEETDHWWGDYAIPQAEDNEYDIVHINSMDATADSVVISLRHTDGIYEIDRDTGEVLWKLGGTPTPESLTVLGDPHASNPLGGQHYARVNADGTLTAFDNGQGQGRPPRAVRYEIDEDAGTATLLEAVGDPDVPSAVCCGSARRSASGSWMMAWGGLLSTPHPVSEFAPDGSRTFVLEFPGTFSYRADAVPAGKLTRAELRAGMNAQHPR